MIDTYVCAASLEALLNFTSQFKDVIPSQKGIPAGTERTDEDGAIVPATEAVGDPDKYYACVRSESTLELPDGVEAVSSNIGEKLLGVWA